MLSEYQFKTVNNAVKECKRSVITVTGKVIPSSTQLMLSSIAFQTALNFIREFTLDST